MLLGVFLNFDRAMLFPPVTAFNGSSSIRNA